MSFMPGLYVVGNKNAVSVIAVLSYEEVIAHVQLLLIMMLLLLSCFCWLLLS